MRFVFENLWKLSIESLREHISQDFSAILSDNRRNQFSISDNFNYLVLGLRKFFVGIRFQCPIEVRRIHLTQYWAKFFKLLNSTLTVVVTKYSIEYSNMISLFMAPITIASCQTQKSNQ